MNKLTVLAIVFLLLPVFSAGAASTTHRKHVAPKARASEPAPAPTPPVTRLPIFSAGAASTTHRKHVAPTAPKARASAPTPAPTPPVTRLPIAPDTFRA